MPKLTSKLRDEYEQLFAACQIRPERRTQVERIAGQVLDNRPRYEAVGAPLGIPWYVVGAIHNLEASLSFRTHLHNGDPLTARTVHVPAGRPASGAPPFSWEDSARDALTLEGMNGLDDWSLSATLYRLEGYNGWGYRKQHPDVLSPYLWSFSNQYERGKYVADGKWSASAVSDQCGAATLLRRLAELQQVVFPPRPNEAPATPQLVRYSPTKLRNPVEYARAVALQEWLNTHPGIYVRVDGAPGPRTSDAWRALTGSYLPGDPRAG
ncbi:hypothetical protein [Solimonas soli]|uniref:hypothetical protein n=1 Tax=Solimonas soli TaxID=413479 RepID=UPI000483E3CC|nr:hypothetical protein [Solimonas soli]